MQGSPIVQQRRYHRNFTRLELQGKFVLFENRRFAPPCRAIELGDQWRRILYTDLVDAILVTVQRQESPAAGKPERFHRRQDIVRLQLLVGEGRVRLGVDER